MDLRKIIKEEIEDFEWMGEIPSTFIPGQKYTIKSGNNWDTQEFVEFVPNYKHEHDGEVYEYEMYKFKSVKGHSTSHMSKQHVDDLVAKGLVRIFEEDFNFESLLDFGTLNDIDGRNFAIYFRDGISLDDTIPIQEELFKRGFSWSGVGQKPLTSVRAKNNKPILLIESINWDNTDSRYKNMPNNMRDEKKLLFANFPEYERWHTPGLDNDYLEKEKERSTNELTHHNALVIDGHKLLSNLMTEQNDIDWISDVPNYLTFDDLEFAPHPITKGLPDSEFLQNRFGNSVQASMKFGDDGWISVIGGNAFSLSNIEDDVYEVWSNLLPDPVRMNRDEITEHMKELQGVD